MTTLASILFGNPVGGSWQRIAAVLGSGNFDLQSVRIGGAAVPMPEVVNAVAQLLDMPVGNIALQGWHQQREVLKAKAETAGQPGTREVVRVLQHTITSKQSPTVRATAGAASVTILTLDLEVEIKVSSADLVVEAGQMTQARAGSAVAKAKLSASGTTLAEREFQPVDLNSVRPEQSDHDAPMHRWRGDHTTSRGG